MALRIAHGIADTMAVAHARGIVHRDLKPSNVMLTGAIEDANVKLLDFGVARPPADLKLAHTVEQAIIGSPGYMSPEAATGGETTDRSDVFSLGVTLFRMLVGELLFEPSLDREAVLALMSCPAPSARERRPEVSDELASLVDAMLAKDARERPAMATLRSQLARMLPDDMPSQVAPVSQPGSAAVDPSAATAAPLDALGSTAGVLPPTVLSEERLPTALPALRAELEKLADERLAPQRSRAPWFIAAAALVVGAGGVAAVVALTRSDEPTPALVQPPRPVERQRLTALAPEVEIKAADLAEDARRLVTVEDRSSCCTMSWPEQLPVACCRRSWEVPIMCNGFLAPIACSFARLLRPKRWCRRSTGTLELSSGSAATRVRYSGSLLRQTAMAAHTRVSSRTEPH